MTDHELLLAISGMLDTKLKAEVQALKAELHEELQSVKAEFHAELQSVKAELQEAKTEIQKVKAELQTLKEEVRVIKLYQQDVIIPRLNTIEACYTGTYRRYARYVEKMESVFQDVEVLKVVVAEHSEKLKKLA